jgi:hypothetical protein
VIGEETTPIGRGQVELVVFQASPTKDTAEELQYLSSIGEWSRRDIQHCQFKNYDLIYTFYSKFPS